MPDPTDDDLPPLPDEPPPTKPTFWQRFLGPENAAGLGGWAGVFGPAGVLAAWAAAAGGAGYLSEIVLALMCTAAGSLIVGVLAGGIGSRVVTFVQRRRGVAWPPWRSQFLGGFAAGVLATVALAAIAATLAV